MEKNELDWPENLDLQTLLEHLGNCLRTAALCSGHFKAAQNERLAEALWIELCRRNYPVSAYMDFKRELIAESVFNGPGSY